MTSFNMAKEKGPKAMFIHAILQVSVVLWQNSQLGSIPILSQSNRRG